MTWAFTKTFDWPESSGKRENKVNSNTLNQLNKLGR